MGEQFLPDDGACLLGSINLTKFVKNPFTEDSYFDFEGYQKVIKIFTRMLDNVVELNNLPLPEQRHEIETKRRHGMGYFGLGSAMTMMCMKYGDDDSLAFTEMVTAYIALVGWDESSSLASEKGIAPLFNSADNLNKFVDSNYFKSIKNILSIKNDYHNINRVLNEKFNINCIMEDLKTHGSRFTHHSSIAPTGTLALSFGNNASNGIEPSFAHSYLRNVIVQGKKTKEQIEVMSYECLLWKSIHGDKPLPNYFVTADQIDPIDHIKVQAVAQKWIDSSISKTINVATDYDYEKFKGLYETAYDLGLKGCTTYRYNPTVLQGVLMNKDDLQNTSYEFTLDDGSIVTVKGDEKIQYDGEVHTAGNLFDALKENTYGKY